MIKIEDVYKIGTLAKPHGVKGEVVLQCMGGGPSHVPESDFVFLMLDGILVPFFVEEFRLRGDGTALLKLEGMDVPEKVRRFTGVEVYADREDDSLHEGEPLSWQWFVGFEVYDVEQGFLGHIEHIDDSTANVLFVIVDEEWEELLVPACEEFIVGIDRKERILDMELPEGLVE